MTLQVAARLSNADALATFFETSLPDRWCNAMQRLQQAAATGDPDAALRLQALQELNLPVRIEVELSKGDLAARVVRFSEGRVQVLDEAADDPVHIQVRFGLALAQRLLALEAEQGPLQLIVPHATLRRLNEPSTFVELCRHPLVFECRLQDVPDLGDGSVWVGVGEVSLDAAPPCFRAITPFADLRTPAGQPWDVRQALVEGKLEILGDMGAAMQLAFCLI